ncbi:MAG: glycosyltransferase family 4 protein, partial [Oscillospiraceae bacterium]|nr:glycosyltransferase family 4 protein [Oscillospiraceae bacterium]
MKICFFSAKYLPTVGGVERYTYNLAKRLVREGHEVFVVTSCLKGLPARERDGEGIEIFRLPVYHLMNDRFPFIKPCMEFKELARELWQENIDLCVINNHFYSSSVWAACACAKRGVPALLIGHATQYLMTGNPILSLAGRLYEHACAAIVKRKVK